MRRARWKRKNVRRVGLRQRRPPAAGGGWLAAPHGGQGRKRPALGEPFGPGKLGIPSASLPAAAGSSAQGRERQRKEKQRQCVNHPDVLRTIRHGTAVPKTAEGPSVPDGQPKSEQAPIRRPPCARRATAPECAKRFSLWTVHGPFSFRPRPKRKWGVHPRWTSPLREQNPPWPPFGGPSQVTSACRCAPPDSRW